MPKTPRYSLWDKVYRELRQEPYASEAVRLTTIQILGTIAIANGFLIAFTIPDSGGALLWFDRVWGWPVFVGIVLGCSGLMQLWAVMTHHPRIAAVACYACSMWYALFSAGFAVMFVSWATGAETCTTATT